MDQDQVLSPSDENLDFDDDTLKAIAKVYLEEGDKEYGRNEPLRAIYFYTEGLQVNCKDDKLNTKLYSNRARAYFHLGNYQEALDDAAAAVKLEPTSTEAIETGARACVQLQCYEDAITWCDKGLAISFDNISYCSLPSMGCGPKRCTFPKSSILPQVLLTELLLLGLFNFL